MASKIPAHHADSEDESVMIISIKPHWADAIARGEKTIELRRRRPLIIAGQPFIVYSTLPEGRLVTLGRITEVIEGTPDEIWHATQESTMIGRDDFDAYFGGASAAYGLCLDSSSRLVEQPTLQELRDRSGFIAPQSWQFATPAQCLSMFSTSWGREQISQSLSMSVHR